MIGLFLLSREESWKVCVCEEEEKKDEKRKRRKIGNKINKNLKKKKKRNEKATKRGTGARATLAHTLVDIHSSRGFARTSLCDFYTRSDFLAARLGLARQIYVPRCTRDPEGIKTSRQSQREFLIPILRLSFTLFPLYSLSLFSSSSLSCLHSICVCAHVVLGFFPLLLHLPLHQV